MLLSLKGWLQQPRQRIRIPKPASNNGVCLLCGSRDAVCGLHGCRRELIKRSAPAKQSMFGVVATAREQQGTTRTRASDVKWKQKSQREHRREVETVRYSHCPTGAHTQSIADHRSTWGSALADARGIPKRIADHRVFHAQKETK